MSVLHDFAAWLAHSSLNAAVTAQAWIVPEIQIVHIVAIAAVVIAAAQINLHALGLFETGQPGRAVMRSWFPVLLGALPVLAVTGFLLIASEPGRAMFRTVFWVKMALIVVATGITAAHGLPARSTGTTARQSPGFVPCALAVGSLLAWIGVIFAGRWIAYAHGWPGAFS